MFGIDAGWLEPPTANERLMNILIGLVTIVHVLVAVFVIVLVLMQKSSEQGVSAAFGGGVTETVFGAGTTTALVRMTVYCGCTPIGDNINPGRIAFTPWGREAAH